MLSIARGFEFPPCEGLGIPWLAQILERGVLVNVAFEPVNEAPLEYCIRFLAIKCLCALSSYFIFALDFPSE